MLMETATQTPPVRIHAITCCGLLLSVKRACTGYSWPCGITVYLNIGQLLSLFKAIFAELCVNLKYPKRRGIVFIYIYSCFYPFIFTAFTGIDRDLINAHSMNMFKIYIVPPSRDDILLFYLFPIISLWNSMHHYSVLCYLESAWRLTTASYMTVFRHI